MVQITNVEKDLSSNYGVDIAVTISTKEPNPKDFIKHENFDLANELYAKTADHIEADELVELTSSAMSTYDPSVIATIFDKLVRLDQQSYYDAISIVQSIVLAKDLDNRTKFLDDIKHVSDENYTPEVYNSSEDIVDETSENEDECTIDNYEIMQTPPDTDEQGE